MTIASQLEIPDLSTATGTPDVEISLNAVTQTAGHSWTRGGYYAVLGDQYLLDIEGVARYYVEHGNRIVIEPTGDDESGVRAFLFGPVFGALLFQRKALAFCATALETPRGAILLVGLPASGKSTAAAVLAQRGYRVLTDGLCAVSALQGRFDILPGLSTLQLWADVLSHVGIKEHTATPWRRGLRKYAVPASRPYPDPLPLARIYGLAMTNCTESRIECVSGFDKCAVLAESTHSRRYLRGMDPSGRCFHQVMRLAAGVSVSKLTRPHLSARYDAVADLLEQDFTA